MLKERLARGDGPLLIDVREPWEFEICHIPGSRSVPMKQIPARSGEFDPQREIVVICHYGMRSAQVAAYLTQRGMDKVMNLSGGVDAWARLIDETMPTY